MEYASCPAPFSFVPPTIFSAGLFVKKPAENEAGQVIYSVIPADDIISECDRLFQLPCHILCIPSNHHLCQLLHKEASREGDRNILSCSLIVSSLFFLLCEFVDFFII